MSGSVVLGAVGIVVSTLAAIATVYFLARSAAREAEREHRAEIAEAVKEATEPLQTQLTQMTAERNYQRDRADRLAEQGRQNR